MVECLARGLGADLVETHISWVLLAGELAYKLKKPLHLPFVDYSTLERRLHFCEEELRLNRRLAPGMYLGVSRVTGTIAKPVIDGMGPVLEYAVRMKRFPAGALFSEQLEAGTLGTDAVDRFAQVLSIFHAQAATVSASIDPEGDLPRRRSQAALAGARALFPEADAAALGAWLDTQWQGGCRTWRERLAQGSISDGHGDLHLANVVLVDGDVAAFDCIEFDPVLRAVDPVDDAAFALMDFAARGRADLGWRFFNAWLEGSGACDGLALLRFWLASRALVRAQVEHLRTPHGPAARRYAQAALHWSAPPSPRLVITHGLPGSGKTFASQQWLQAQGAVRVRSDVERKRLFGLDPLADTRAHGMAAYTAQATRRTYERLLSLARVALQAGWPVVLDAAFLRREERAAARALAHELQAPFAILACEAPPQILRERLRARKGDASEADEQVLASLLATAEPLDASERAVILRPP